MHHTLAKAATRAELALAGIFTPAVLVPLVIALALLWYLVPGSYRLVGESEAQLIEQAQGICAEKGGDFTRQSPGMLPAGAPVEVVFTCQ